LFREIALKLQKSGLIASGFVSKVGTGFLLVCMLITVVNIVLRYFGTGIAGSVELVEFAMVIIVFFSIGHIQAIKGNIAVKFLYNRLPEKWRSFLDLLSSIVTFLLYCLFVYAAVLQTAYIYKVKEISTVYGIPKYPFFGCMAFGLMVLCYILLGDFLVFLSNLLHKDHND
jgi:TRAP-type C4-dicarboxylate transport system permease small subunit